MLSARSKLSGTSMRKTVRMTSWMPTVELSLYASFPNMISCIGDLRTRFDSEEELLSACSAP